MILSVGWARGSIKLMAAVQQARSKPSGCFVMPIPTPRSRASMDSRPIPLGSNSGGARDGVGVVRSPSADSVDLCLYRGRGPRGTLPRSEQLGGSFGGSLPRSRVGSPQSYRRTVGGLDRVAAEEQPSKTPSSWVFQLLQKRTKGDQAYSLLPTVAGVYDHAAHELTDVCPDVGGVVHVRRGRNGVGI